MGSLLYFDEMLPAADQEALGQPGSARYVELIKTSGDHELHLRIGPLGQEAPSEGFRVKFDRDSARRFFDGLEGAMIYLGYLDG